MKNKPNLGLDNCKDKKEDDMKEISSTSRIIGEGFHISVNTELDLKRKYGYKLVRGLYTVPVDFIFDRFAQSKNGQLSDPSGFVIKDSCGIRDLELPSYRFNQWGTMVLVQGNVENVTGIVNINFPLDVRYVEPSFNISDLFINISMPKPLFYEPIDSNEGSEPPSTR